MYAGVLLVYTKIIAYCPTAQPPTRDVVFALVDENNKDKSSGDTISEEEFEELDQELDFLDYELKIEEELIDEVVKCN